MLISKAIQGFVHHLQSKERSSETIRGYRIVLLDFTRHIERELNGSVYLDEITVELLESYLSYRKEQGDQPVSRNRSLYIFRSFYAYLIRRDIVDRDLSQKLEPIKVQQKERHYLTSQQAQEFLDAIEHPLVQVAAITLVNTGLRVSELCHLTLEDVDLDKGLVQVRCGKGKKDRTVPINSQLHEVLANYKKTIRPSVQSHRFFATAKTGQLSDQHINRCLKNTSKKLGWKEMVTAHILRHSFASILVKNKAPLADVQALLGHSDLRVTSRYIHQDLNQLKDTVDLLSDPSAITSGNGEQTTKEKG